MCAQKRVALAIKGGGGEGRASRACLGKRVDFGLVCGWVGFQLCSLCVVLFVFSFWCLLESWLLLCMLSSVNNICTVVVPAFGFNLVSSGRMVVVRYLV